MQSRALHGVYLLALFALSCSSAAPSHTSNPTARPSLNRLKLATHKEAVATLPPVCSDEQGEVGCSFDIINDKDVPVTFKSVFPSCGCSKAQLTHLHLEPNETATLQMEVDLKGRTGYQSFVARLQSEEGQSWCCRFQLYVFPRASFSTRSLTLGLLEPGATSTQSFDLHCSARTQQAVPRLLSLRSNHEDVQIIDEFVSSNPEQLQLGAVVRAHTVKVVVRARNQVGDHRATVTATILAQGERQTVAMDVSWRVRSQYDITPARLAFRRSAKRHLLNIKEVRISRRDRGPLKVIEVQSMLKDVVIDCPLDDVMTSQAILLARYQPTDSEELQWGEIRIALDDPAEPVLVVPVSLVP